MKKIMCLGLAWLLTGCSTQLAYNNLDFVVSWYLDDYIELNKTQEKAFDESFSRIWHWHRQQELVKYHQHLLAFKSDLFDQQITAEQLQSHFLQASDHWRRLRNYVAPDLVSLAKSLTDQQVDYFFAQLDKKNQERKEDRPTTDEEIVRERIDNLRDNVAEWVGRLNRQQKGIIDKYATQYVSESALWLEYRVKSQAQLKQLFAEADRGEKFQTDLLSILANPEQFRSPELIASLDHNRPIYAQMLVDILASLTDKQKRRLKRRLDDMLGDLEALAFREG